MLKNKSFSTNLVSIERLILEIRSEQKISPMRKNAEFKNYVLQGIFDIEEKIGSVIDFDIDLKARALLKDYVLYADHNLLKDFFERYSDDYFYLQAKYSRDTNIS